MAWSLGYGIPLCSKLVCTLIGVSSTKNLSNYHITTVRFWLKNLHPLLYI
ncbi:hypothetical protein Hanom_Chr00s000004g01607031 [Helianthus anomalus]